MMEAKRRKNKAAKKRRMNFARYIIIVKWTNGPFTCSFCVIYTHNIRWMIADKSKSTLFFLGLLVALFVFAYVIRLKFARTPTVESIEKCFFKQKIP